MDATKPMTATEWLRWVVPVGITLGSLLWTMYTWLYAGARLRVTAEANMIMWPTPPGNPHFLRITVQNVGKGPTTITNLAFMTFLSRRARWRGRPSNSWVILEYQGPPLHHKLDGGCEFVARMEQDEEFDKQLSSGNLWCAVYHSSSKKFAMPVLSKIVVGPRADQEPSTK